MTMPDLNTSHSLLASALAGAGPIRVRSRLQPFASPVIAVIWGGASPSCRMGWPEFNAHHGAIGDAAGRNLVGRCLSFLSCVMGGFAVFFASVRAGFSVPLCSGGDHAGGTNALAHDPVDRPALDSFEDIPALPLIQGEKPATSCGIRLFDDAKGPCHD